ncbi:MAG: RsmB/NOP family class I SAM-dependent RNA methyltransferase [Mucinivorans sp.]
MSDALSKNSVALPADFVATQSADLCRALDETQRAVSIRLNPYKPFEHSLTDRVAWAEDGFYLPSRPVFTLDPIFAAGGYYVQEASSMAVGWIIERLELPDNPVVLDLCAAPGGKSTHLSSIIGRDGVLVANETIRSRAGVLCQNIQKWGAGNTIVTSADAAAFARLGALFDLVVVDAPCSGEGMFGKDMAARGEWSLDNVAKCAARQRRVVGDVWDSLKEGGYLIYSTCTFNSHENQENVAWIARELGAEIISLGDMPGGGVSNRVAGYNFYPNLVRGEGFYVAVLRKTSMACCRQLKLPRAAFPLSDLYTERPLHLIDQGGQIYGYTSALYMMVEALRASRIFMLTSGVELGEQIHGRLKPSFGAALYFDLRRDLFPVTVLSREQSLLYLRRSSLDASLFSDSLSLVSYSSLGLGFAKRIGMRVNNMYPIAWRIATL